MRFGFSQILSSVLRLSYLFTFAPTLHQHLKVFFFPSQIIKTASKEIIHIFILALVSIYIYR